MKYFFDTEFIEGNQENPLMLKSRLGHWMIGYPKPTIDLISIGIVCEDGREYYAISKDFNLKEAWNRYQLKTEIKINRLTGSQFSEEIKVREYWIRENVLNPIFDELNIKDLKGQIESLKNYGYPMAKGIKKKDVEFSYSRMKYLIKKYGKSNEQIAKEIKTFVSSCEGQKYLENCPNIKTNVPKDFISYNDIQFYAYYADYDWVAFCWLYGKMIDLPKGFPKYCIDLKQEFDRKLMLKSTKMIGQIEAEGKSVPWRTADKYSLDERLKIFKSLARYPKQENEHNALADAKWNFELYKFLKDL